MSQTTIHASIDNRIRVALSDLPDDAGLAMVESLTFDNLEKRQAIKQNQAGAGSLPDKIELWSLEGDELSFPRGFRHDFEDGLAFYGCKVAYDDRRNDRHVFRIGKRPEPRDHQPAAIEAIIKHQDMIYKAPTGSGKTMTSLLAIRQLAVPSIVIVNTLSIAEQWVVRAQQALGDHYPVSIIGDGKFEISPYLTVATAQTLWSRYEKLKADGFFDLFGAAVLDECHHATATTYAIILDSFTAKWRWGVSATPEKTGDFRIAQAVLGPVKHETPLSLMFEKGYLLKPKIVKINSRFGYGFRGSSGRRQSNYSSMISALVKDDERQDGIAANIMRNAQRHQLVLSAQLGQLDDLERRIREMGFVEGIWFLTGRDDEETRERTINGIAERPGVVFSTIANEALDVPILERVHLAFPQKNTGLITQQIGRAMRNLPGKKTPIIFDYTDNNVGPLEAQWNARSREVYRPLGCEIERIKITDILELEGALA